MTNKIPCFIIQPERVVVSLSGDASLLLDIEESALIEGDTLSGLQAAVGGPVACFDIDIDGPDGPIIATVWFHDEGKVIGLRRNVLAEAIAVGGGWPGPEWGDWIAGPVVITGFDRELGETVALPEEWKQIILASTAMIAASC